MKFQDIKFYVLCRHKLNVDSKTIFFEIRKLFGPFLNRSYEESVVRWKLMKPRLIAKATVLSPVTWPD